ncbi:MAG: hydroxyethylthiazole kinase [Aminobacterium sp.]|jgi:hydroxyethylthiazole kinase|uniref:hydroxyethylthiazole kinase n=1 Tax=unclassified Aminobacterium TaxID=2685012 RepID=UPI001BCBE1D5|nr:MULTISPECIES: hydroxyethylthiazole kinase [unclassified Aminobacterium]MDD2206593.1 hydroxyethylthiazole kinase [Aminobacterium sp.]MDD3425494.1 hydroxyethylthiazole kinase [Aminobacterium sp.]MDD3706843.1 hydroxyethylthiazole kinase [Aminobacterium sp.]MDD4228660.1 hydroxyethylthiazole kinase [Aminobacterium sp.]MDD4551588.1 hydroxyethylthiazole kinase [Aminobacterium sp.]
MRQKRANYKGIYLSEVWESVRQHRPLVYHITNMVAANFQANVCLAAGASPLMSLKTEEAPLFADQADSILINTGTPTTESCDSMRAVLPVIKKRGKPLVLDPVGYGASPFRISIVKEILESNVVSVVKGNRGEMSLLGEEKGAVLGVDSLGSDNIERALLHIASSYDVVAVATGEDDMVVTKSSPFLLSLPGGNSLFPQVTASGCVVGTLIAACAAVTADFELAATTALVAATLASERASQRGNVEGPASFQNAFIDEIYHLSPGAFSEYDERFVCKEVEER